MGNYYHTCYPWKRGGNAFTELSESPCEKEPPDRICKCSGRQGIRTLGVREERRGRNIHISLHISPLIFLCLSLDKFNQKSDSEEPQQYSPQARLLEHRIGKRMRIIICKLRSRVRYHMA